MGKVVCPKCEKDDQIQKVSSLVRGGVSTVNYRNVFGNVETAESQTLLSSRLSPPAKPMGLAKDITSNLLPMFGLGILSGILFQAVLGSWDNLLPFYIGLCSPVVLVLLYIIFWGQKIRAAIPKWEEQISNWNRLYYCYRDDCVFDPQSGKHSSPQGMDRLL